MYVSPRFAAGGHLFMRNNFDLPVLVEHDHGNRIQQVFFQAKQMEELTQVGDFLVNEDSWWLQTLWGIEGESAFMGKLFGPRSRWWSSGRFDYPPLADTSFAFERMGSLPGRSAKHLFQTR